MKTVADVFKKYKVGQVDRMLELLGNATDEQKSMFGNRHWYMITDIIEILEKTDD
jgi:hypothetical protein